MRPPNRRPLTDTEIDHLERALGERNVRQLGKALGKDGREALAQRVAQIIRDIMCVAVQPTPPDPRGQLRRVARQGRRWLRDLAEEPVGALVRTNTNFEQLKGDITRFCDQLDAIREWTGAGKKPGAPRQRLLMQVAIGELIGVAKLAGVPPSSPGRAIWPKKPLPRFYKFVLAALYVGKEIALSSSLTKRERQAVQSAFDVQNEEALVKQIEIVRGRVGDYVPSQSGHGLVERRRH